MKLIIIILACWSTINLDINAFTFINPLKSRTSYRKTHDFQLCSLQPNVNTDNADDEQILKGTHKNNSSRRDFLLKYTSIAATASATIFTLRPPPPSFASTTTSSLVLPTPITTTTSSSILCDPSVSIFQHPTKKRTVYLLGTAHISSNSAEAAATLVREMKPKAVFIELDAKRVGRAIPKPNPETWPNVPQQSSAEDVQQQGSSITPTTNNNPSISITVSNTENNNDGTVTKSNESINVISSPITIAQQQDQGSIVKNNKPKFFDFREMALRKGSEVIGNSIKGLYSKLESEGFNAGEGMSLFYQHFFVILLC